MRRRPAPLPVVAALAMGVGCALAALPANRLGAQEPEDTVAASPAAPAEASAPADYGYTPPRFALSLTVAGLGERPLQRQPVLAERRDADGTVLETSGLHRRVDAKGGFGATLSGLASLGPRWAVRLGVGLSRATLDVDYGGEDEIFVAAARHLAASEATTVTVVEAEGAMRMRIPSGRRAQPYLELGAVAMRWQASSTLPGAAALGEGVHRVAGTAAAGLLVPFGDRVSARLHGSARIYRTPVDTAESGSEGSSSSSLAVTFEPPESGLFADAAHELSTALRLDMGISLGLGGAIAMPAPPAEAAPTAPPGS